MADIRQKKDDEAFRAAADLWLEQEIVELTAQSATPEEDAFIRAKLAKIMPRPARRVSKSLIAAACVAITLLGGFSAAVAISEPFRFFIINLIITQKSSHTEYNKHIIVPENWKGMYFPMYIPDDFTCVTIDFFDRAALFENEKGQFFQFIEYKPTDTIQIDTESSTEEAVYIQGEGATLFRKKEMLYILWDHNDRLFLISGNIEDSIALKVADSIRFCS